MILVGISPIFSSHMSGSSMVLFVYSCAFFSQASCDLIWLTRLGNMIVTLKIISL